MPFRLFYRGPLKSNGRPKDKHEIRLKFHPQLIKLWEQERMKEFTSYLTKKDPIENGKISILDTVGGIDYACLVTDRLKLYAELDILFLRPGEPGQLITKGDIDNRLKTLFDALRRPQNKTESPKGDLLSRTPNPCHCVLSEDSLISRVSVTADTLLDAQSDYEVVLIITVTVLQRVVILGNISYIH
jgi:hypothetical protein